MAPRMRRQQRRRTRANTRALPRAMRFLGNHRRSTFLAYFALIIASMAQLAVPQLTQNMINAITDGAFAKEVLDSAPPEAHESIARAAGTTAEALQRARDHAGEWLRDAALIIVLFAFVRGAFSFIQTYMAENTSQGVAYDFRNAIYRKVQRLSFSYYDRTHTGQIMIRATDDVERLRIFLAQGLVLTAQSFLLLLATLIILFLTNWQLTLVILPILPVALVLFGAFGAFVRPLFSELQRRLASLNTILQENLAGIRTIKGFRREKEQQARFQHSADDLYTHQIRLATVFSTMFPAHLPGLANRAGYHPLFQRAANLPRRSNPWRLPEFQPLFALRLLPAGAARLHHFARRAGFRLSRAHLRGAGYGIRSAQSR